MLPVLWKIHKSLEEIDDNEVQNFVEKASEGDHFQHICEPTYLYHINTDLFKVARNNYKAISNDFQWRLCC